MGCDYVTNSKNKIGKNEIYNNKKAFALRLTRKDRTHCIGIKKANNLSLETNLNNNEQTKPIPLPREGLISIEDVIKILGIKRTHIYDLINKGVIPKPKKLGACSRWNAEDIWKIVNYT